MSMRPTIAICCEGHIAAIGIYRNRGLGSLLLEAFRLYEHFKDCASAEALSARLAAEYSRRNPGHNMPKETEAERKRLLRRSEFPLIVDLTARCIYYGYRVFTQEELRRRPDSVTMMAGWSDRQVHQFELDHLISFTEKCVFRMEQLDAAEILRLAEQAPEFRQFYW